MTAFMNISVRVESARALTQLRALQAEMRRTNAAGTAANTGLSRIGAQTANLRRFGNQLQWTGRQLQLNFTLPILLAAGAAAKFALDNEKAMTRIVKVYGDGTMSMKQIRSETNALGKAMIALSNRFGIAQADALNIAADWAQAGASGIALAKSVEQTMRIMVLGEMDAAEATKALISIQAQYGLSTKQLAQAIDTLNMIENQTGISMQGLVQGFERSAGMARSAGISVRYLGAMLAAMTPAAGSAAQAGNALKTLLSRIMAPTKDAAAVMSKFGISINSVAWQSMNGAQRLEQLARSWRTLTGSQKVAASATIASRWQINRFNVLMEDMANYLDVVDGKVKKSAAGQSYYGTALNSTEDAVKNFIQAQFELNQVLSSNPQRLKIMWTIMQNAMAEVIQPLIPYLVYLAQKVAELAQWFANLDPATQKLVGVLALLLAFMGPLIRYIGAWMTLFSLMHSFWGVLGRGAIALAGFVGWFLSLALVPFRMISAGIALIASTLPMIGKGLMIFGKGVSFVAVTTGRYLMLVAGGVIRSFGVLMVQGFALIGRNIAVIWAAAMQRVATLTLIGLERAMAAMAVFAAAMVNTFRMLFINLAAMAVAGMKIVGRVFTLAFVDILARVRVFFVLMTRTFALGMANLALVARTALTGIVVWISRLPALIWAGLRAIGPFLLRFGRFLTGPIGLAVSTAISLLVMFHDQVWKLLQNMASAFSQLGQNIADAFGGAVEYAIKAFYALPQGVQRALLAVVNIVKQAALAVYSLFSYFNPFAHHSPSLVESVTAGMAVIARQYGKFKSISDWFAQSVRDLQTFKKVATGLQIAEFTSNRADVKSAMPQNLGLYDNMLAEYKALSGVADTYSKQVDDQAAIVAKWDAKLKIANRDLDKQSSILDGLKSQLDATQKLMDSYQDNITNFANAPIEGMKAFSDAIFENSMEQKKLQLQLLNLGGTDSIDKLRDKYDKLTGDIELMMGHVTDLRGAGAGSEILNPLQAQIEAMRAAQGDITGQIDSSPISALQKQLEELQTQAQRLDLEQSLKFDPLTRQVDQLANGMKELPFDQIIAGIKQNQAAMATIQPTLDAQTAAVAKQQQVVDTLTQARDALQASYDTEKQKLDDLNDAMSKYADQVSALKSALDQLASASATAISSGAAGGRGGGAMGPGEAAFEAGALGDFPKVGGGFALGREGGMGDQSKLIEDFAKQQADILSETFGKMDMFGGVKKKWNEFTAWFKKNVGPAFEPFLHIFDGVDFGGMLDSIKSGASGLKGFLQSVGEWAEKIGKLFLPEIKKIWDVLKDNFDKALKTIGPELAKFKDLWGDLKTALKVVGAFVGGQLLMALKIVASVFSNVLGPVLDGVIDLIGDLIRIIRGIAEVVVGVLSGDWKMAWQGIKDIVGGTFEAIWHIIEAAGSILWGIVKGIVEGIVGFFTWLWDVLVGHSIVPDMINAIIEWFQFLLTPIQAVWDAIVWTIQNVVAPVFTWIWQNIIVPAFNGIVTVIQVAWTVIKAIWDGIVWAIQNVLAPVFFWLWDNVIKPVWEGIKQSVDIAWKAIKVIWDAVKWYIENVLGPVFEWIWNNIVKPVWDSIKKAISDAWNNVIKPAWEAMKTVIRDVGTAIDKAWDSVIKPAWNAIKSGIKDGWEKVIKPALDAFKSIGGSIGSAFDKSKKAISDAWGALKSTIGGAIDWIQRKIDGIMGAIRDAKSAASSIASAANPFNWDFNIPTFNFDFGFAAGGQLPQQRVGSGFVTSSARAIVGEGSNQWAEFVIPTDPRYRDRSLALWAQLTKSLGLSGPIGAAALQMASRADSGGGVPHLAGGGILSVTSRTNRVARMGDTGLYDGKREIHFHGDLYFPNVKDGSDAEDFIKNLEGLAG